MGLPICTNLVQAGHQVTAGDNRPDRAGAVRVCGARWRGPAAQVAARAEVLVTVLPGAQELRDVMLDVGALAALPAGAAWIDMTSASPAAARPLQRAAQARGVDVLKAPMGGGVPALITAGARACRRLFWRPTRLALGSEDAELQLDGLRQDLVQ
jgi:3-hydroxyisobutyrate dehydrogenase